MKNLQPIGRGRPKSAKGPLESRPIGFDAATNSILEEMAEAKGTSVPNLVRDAVSQWLAPAPPPSDVHNFRAPYLSAVPCGPWDSAISSGEDFVISDDVANVLEAHEGDVWCSANGQSMEGAGIQDGFIVLLRPYSKGKTPARGHIVLAQAFPEGEEPVGTIKRFNGMNGTRPKLLDGENNEYQLPENTTKVEIVARAVGVVGRL